MNQPQFPFSTTANRKMKDVIAGFHSVDRAMTAAELSDSVRKLRQNDISGNVGFLQACGLLQALPRRRYRLTAFGTHLAQMLNAGDPAELQRCWASIITEKSVFLLEIWEYIDQQIRRFGDIPQRQVQNEIVRRAYPGRPLSGTALFGAKTIIDLMCDAHFLVRRAAGRGQTDTRLFLGPAAAMSRSQYAASAIADPDALPDFSKYLPPDTSNFLQDRWRECVLCVEHGDTPLAASVMVGGLLEALLYIKMKAYPDQGCILRARAVPVDRKRSSKPLPYENWTLNHYIEVARELGWIKAVDYPSAKLVQDYRNVIHPNKQLSQQYDIAPGHAKLSWDSTKLIAHALYP